MSYFTGTVLSPFVAMPGIRNLEKVGLSKERFLRGQAPTRCHVKDYVRGLQESERDYMKEMGGYNEPRASKVVVFVLFAWFVHSSI